MILAKRLLVKAFEAGLLSLSESEERLTLTNKEVKRATVLAQE
jgi:hypothetical protein